MAQAVSSIAEVQSHQPGSIFQAVRAAQAVHKRDRATGLAALNELFRQGTPPAPPVNARCTGELVALNIAPGLTQMMEALLRLWLPWKGKVFEAANECGNNIFTRDSYLPARVFNPFYRDFVDDTLQTYRAFSFHTYIGPGKDDPDRQVLKLDYNLPENPRFTIRRVLDELVQVEDGYYLGKAHLHWLWGKWQMVAYFALRG